MSPCQTLLDNDSFSQPQAETESPGEGDEEEAEGDVSDLFADKDLDFDSKELNSVGEKKDIMENMSASNENAQPELKGKESTKEYSNIQTESKGTPKKRVTLYGIRTAPTEKFVWNLHMLKGVRDDLHIDWMIYIIHGFIGQSSILLVLTTFVCVILT